MLLISIFMEFFKDIFQNSFERIVLVQRGYNQKGENQTQYLKMSGNLPYSHFLLICKNFISECIVSKYFKKNGLQEQLQNIAQQIELLSPARITNYLSDLFDHQISKAQLTYQIAYSLRKQKVLFKNKLLMIQVIYLITQLTQIVLFLRCLHQEQIMTSLRQQSEQLQQRLQKILKCGTLKDQYQDDFYEAVSSVIKFLRQNCEKISGDFLKDAILLVGASGAGKSTTVNYLHSPEDLIISETEGQLKTKNGKSIAKIGEGKGSTTLFPNGWVSDYGNILDCAGEGETSGIIAEVMNSIFKKKVSENVKQTKILFVAHQDSLGAKGNYGMSFKNALDKNSQFLKDINLFKNSIGIIITSAGVRKSALQDSILAIQQIIHGHPNLDHYKDAISHVILSKNIQTFSKPNDALEAHDVYQPPSWNPNQRQNIIAMIQGLPFTKVPSANFFQISTSPDVRQSMKKALAIVEFKASRLIKQVIERALPLNLFAVQLKSFSKFCGELMNIAQMDLLKYLNLLKWNKYFKILHDQKIFNKLHDEMIYLRNFAFDTQEKSTDYSRNWTEISDVGPIFKKVYDETQKILNQDGNNFSKIKSLTNVTSKTAGALAHEVSKNFIKLYESYSQKAEIERLKNDQESKYFEVITKKEFSHKIDVAYKQKEQYVDIENYQTSQEYTVIQSYMIDVSKHKPVTKYKNQQCPVVETETKYRDETYTELTRIGFWLLPKTLSDPNRYYTQGSSQYISRDDLWKQFKDAHDNPDPKYELQTKTRKIPYPASKTIYKTKQISYTEYQPYTEKEERFKPVVKTRQVEKSRPVAKERNVQKIRQEDVYRDLDVREFNKLRYEEDTKDLLQKISKYRLTISNLLKKYPKAQKIGLHCSQAIKSKDQFEELYEDLQEQWQSKEYESYYQEHPDFNLKELGIEAILKLI